MNDEPNPCRCGKPPSVFKIFGEWEVSCEDECAVVQAETKAHAVAIWNERHAAPVQGSSSTEKGD